MGECVFIVTGPVGIQSVLTFQVGSNQTGRHFIWKIEFVTLSETAFTLVPVVTEAPTQVTKC